MYIFQYPSILYRFEFKYRNIPNYAIQRHLSMWHGNISGLWLLELLSKPELNPISRWYTHTKMLFNVIDKYACCTKSVIFTCSWVRPFDLNYYQTTSYAINFNTFILVLNYFLDLNYNSHFFYHILNFYAKMAFRYTPLIYKICLENK